MSRGYDISKIDNSIRRLGRGLGLLRRRWAGVRPARRHARRPVGELGCQLPPTPSACDIGMRLGFMHRAWLQCEAFCVNYELPGG